MTSPRYTVVIPTYNRASSIETALDSIFLALGARKAQIFVVDDGSTDDTVKRLERRNDIQLHRRKTNGGPAQARNAAIPHISGEYTLFLDSDDLLLPDAFAIFDECLLQKPNLIVGFPGKATKMAPPQFVSLPFVRELWSYSGFIGVGGWMIRTSVLRSYDGFWNVADNGEDIDFLLRASDLSGVLVIQNTPTFFQSSHAEQRTRRFWSNAAGFSHVTVRAFKRAYPLTPREMLRILQKFGGYTLRRTFSNLKGYP